MEKSFNREVPIFHLKYNDRAHRFSLFDKDFRINHRFHQLGCSTKARVSPAGKVDIPISPCVTRVMCYLSYEDVNNQS